jgi:P4 family phage/plasmid primase-like protien
MLSLALARMSGSTTKDIPVSTDQASPVTESELTGPQQAVAFIKAMFGHTESPVHICSLGNERDGHYGMRKLDTRYSDEFEKFIAKWDGPERGLFYCVGTLKPGAMARNKENVTEIAFLFADIDLKDIDGKQADVERILSTLRCPPSCTVFSGHGVHAYWSLTESIVNPSADGGEQDRIESALRQLADVVGGDLQVCEIARLMRLPGTHNTKRGENIPAVVLTSTGKDYELSDLEEWLSEQSPVILRKKRERAMTVGEAGPAENPYLDYCKRNGIKTPIDATKRLEAMMFMSGGGSSVHATQLAVTASMLNKGHDIEEAVELVLEATKVAAGDYGKRWNWKKEEQTIRGMCSSWVKKHGAMANGEANTNNAGTAGATVLALAQPKPRPKPKLKPNELHHVKLGMAVVDIIKDRGDDLLFTPKGGAWRYSNGLWSMADAGMTAWLNVEIEKGAQAMDYSSTSKNINETRLWIMRQDQLWRENVEWDSHGLIPTRSGLLDPMTGNVIAAKPEHFVTWRIESAYDPTATCPWWLQMLEDCFADRSGEERAALVAVIQELLGAGLIDKKPREISKALIFQGGSNFGKSGLLEVLGGLFGNEVNSTSIEALEGAHGSMAFLNRRPWVLHEAFDQRKWHFSSKVKTIITGEPLDVNVKNGPLLTVRIRVPIFWGTNHPPQFKEATKAVVNRLVVIECRREFKEDAPVGAQIEATKRRLDKPSSLVLADELPGVLAWAVLGLRRALERGHLSVTHEMAAIRNEIRRDSNLVAGFLEECCAYDPDYRVSTADFALAFAAWWAQEKGENRSAPSNEQVGKALIAMADRRIAIDRKELRDNTHRYYAGIVLNASGLAFHQAGLINKAMEGKTASASIDSHDVNQRMSHEWLLKPAVKAMQQVHFDMHLDDLMSIDTTTGDKTDVPGPVTSTLSMAEEPHNIKRLLDQKVTRS